MNRHLLTVMFSVLLWTAFTRSLPAAAAEGQNLAQPEALCMPGIYLAEPGDCLPAGPSVYLTEMARQGLVLPLQPLPAAPLDPMLGELPYLYARLMTERTPVYATLDDAIAEATPFRYIAYGELKYVTYYERVDNTANGTFYRLRSGGWARAGSKHSPYRSFSGGLVFQQPPLNSFGWVLPFMSDKQSKRTPGYQTSDYTGRTFKQYEVVQIYAMEQVGDLNWYKIGPDEWVEQRAVAMVTPENQPPDGVTNGRWISVNLYEQTLAVYDAHRLVFATVIASGQPPFHTKPGLFPIYQTYETTNMSGAFEADRSDYYYLEDVPYTLYYDGARALHGAYWRAFMGYKQSHGCVNMTIGDAHWVFDWANEGDWVYVWDPSGETPTDPNAYGEGGA